MTALIFACVAALFVLGSVLGVAAYAVTSLVGFAWRAAVPHVTRRREQTPPVTRATPVPTSAR